MFSFEDLYCYFLPLLCWPFCSVDLFVLLTFFVLLTSAMLTFLYCWPLPCKPFLVWTFLTYWPLLLFSPMWSSPISFPINLRTAWILLKILLLFYFMLLSESLFSLEPLLLLMCVGKYGSIPCCWGNSCWLIGTPTLLQQWLKLGINRII